MAFVTSVAVAPRSIASVSSSVSTFNGIRTWTAPRSRRAALIMNLETIQTKIDEEMKKAQEATAKYGKGSKEAALAWDVVEELEAKASDMKTAKGTVDPLEEYCADAPEADECRMYED